MYRHRYRHSKPKPKLFLTDREHQILVLVASGLSDEEISQKLSISRRTTNKHMENLRVKMDAKNRIHVIIKSLKHGLLFLEEIKVD